MAIEYKGPMRFAKADRRIGETPDFAARRKKNRVRNKIAKKSRKK